MSVLNLLLFTFICFTSFQCISCQNGLGFVIKYESQETNSTFLPFEKCHNSTPFMDKFPDKFKIPEFFVNLDDPPEKRWIQLVLAMKTQIYKFRDIIYKASGKLFGSSVHQFLNSYLPVLSNKLPYEYYQELAGIAQITELPIGEIILLNTIFEFGSFSTSIILEDTSGNLIHGRNLEFSFMLRNDEENITSIIAEHFRKLAVKVDFIHNSHILYTSVTFASYVGILTSLKMGSFSLSVNRRMKPVTVSSRITEWIIERKDQKWNGIIAREIVENSYDFKDAEKTIAVMKTVTPLYFVLTGLKSGQGIIMTKDGNITDVRRIGFERKKWAWYLIQTNYNRWKKLSRLDDRHIPAMICLELLGRQNASYTLFNVLSTPPILNQMTVYSALIEPQTGNLMSWIQNCYFY